jgi:MFS family permease
VAACGAVSNEALPRAAYTAFLLGTASWFVAWGLQSVVFAWLVVSELGESPARVGLAQTAALLPAVPLVLLGGALGDRRDPSGILAALHLSFGVVLAGLVGVIATGALSYPLLLAFAAASGSLNALQVPARDAQLYPLARAALSRGVVGANLVSQVGQAFGGIAGTALGWLGAPVVIAIQAALAVSGAAPSLWLRNRVVSVVPPPEPSRGRVLADVAGGLRVALRSPELRPVLLLTTLVGLLFVGVYGVVLPLLVRDAYRGGPRELSLLLSMVPLGGIAGGVAIYLRGGIRRNGRALVVGQAFSAACIGSLAAAPPFAGACAAVFGWGAGSAYFLAAGRTLFHLGAPPAQRATLLGLYSLGILGTGPIGSLLSGLLVGAVGPHRALALQAGAMLLGIALVTARSRILHGDA